MKKIALVLGVLVFSSSLFSCGSASSCATNEKYNPEYLNLEIDLATTSELSDIAELEVE